MDIRFHILITPVAKERARFTKLGHAYTPSKTKEYENAIRDALQSGQYTDKLIDYPIAVSMIFELPRPKKPKFDVPAVRPDVDNYAKAVLDAFNGVLYTDDALVCDLTCIKRYSETPGIWVRISSLDIPC